MELVVDSNIVISALIADRGKTAELLFLDRLKLFAPEFLLEEIKKYESDICAKSGLSKQEIETALDVISGRITFVPASEFKQYVQKAEAICPDPKDALYFALALKYGCAIWSNDKTLQNQNCIKILTTPEIIKKLQR